MTAQTDNKPVEQPQAQQTQVTPAQNNTQTEEEKQPKNSKEWDAFKSARAAERQQAEINAKEKGKAQAEAAALKAALDAVLNKPQPQQYEQQEQREESEDERIEKRVAEALQRQQKIYEDQRKEKERTEYPDKLAKDFKDFSEVCSTENLDYMDYHYPEISGAFSYMPEGYVKWASVYKAVKRLIPNPTSSKDSKKAEHNMMKPQSMSAAGPTNTNSGAPAFKLDAERKAANWQRMEKIRMGLS